MSTFIHPCVIKTHGMSIQLKSLGTLIILTRTQNLQSVIEAAM